jgi:hypothetical protein
MLLLNNRDCIHFSYFESSIEVPLFNRASSAYVCSWLEGVWKCWRRKATCEG